MELLEFDILSRWFVDPGDRRQHLAHEGDWSQRRCGSNHPIQVLRRRESGICPPIY